MTMPASILNVFPGILMLLSVWTLCYGQSRTQSYSQQEVEQLANLTPTSAGVRSIDLAYEGVRGTPYISPVWLIGRVLFRSKDVFSGKMLLNINLEKNSLHFQLADGTPGTFDPKIVSAIIVKDSSKVDSTRYAVYSGSEVVGKQRPQAQVL